MLLFVCVLLMTPAILILIPSDIFRMFISVQSASALILLGIYVYAPTFFFLGSCFSFFHLTVKRQSPFCLPNQDGILMRVHFSEAIMVSLLGGAVLLRASLVEGVGSIVVLLAVVIVSFLLFMLAGIIRLKKIARFSWLIFAAIVAIPFYISRIQEGAGPVLMYQVFVEFFGLYFAAALLVLDYILIGMETGKRKEATFANKLSRAKDQEEPFMIQRIKKSNEWRMLWGLYHTNGIRLYRYFFLSSFYFVLMILFALSIDAIGNILAKGPSHTTSGVSLVVFLSSLLMGRTITYFGLCLPVSRQQFFRSFFALTVIKALSLSFLTCIGLEIGNLLLQNWTWFFVSNHFFVTEALSLKLSLLPIIIVPIAVLSSSWAPYLIAMVIWIPLGRFIPNLPGHDLLIASVVFWSLCWFILYRRFNYSDLRLTAPGIFQLQGRGGV